MKPTLNEEIEMSQKGIDYVNSLEVKDDIIYGECILYDGSENVKDIRELIRPEFPNDRMDKQQMIDLGISNDIPEYMQKEKLRREKAFKNKALRFIILLLCAFAILLLSSCKTSILTAYKVSVNKQNYYVNDIKLSKDSVYFTEYNRNGTIRNKGAYLLTDVKIER